MTGFVYFMRCLGMESPIKIGYSSDPYGRMKAVQASSPFKLEIAVVVEGDGILEQKIHRCLANSHSHAEWFYPTQEVTDLVSALMAGTPLADAIDLTKQVCHVRVFGRRRTRVISPVLLVAPTKSEAA